MWLHCLTKLPFILVRQIFFKGDFIGDTKIIIIIGTKNICADIITNQQLVLLFLFSVILIIMMGFIVYHHH